MNRRKPLRRPSRAMMMAVNAAIDGDRATVDRIVEENDLDYAELEQRLESRAGRKYDKTGKKKGKKPAVSSARPSGAGSANSDFDVNIDGRTSVAKLFKLIEQAEQIKVMAQRELKRRSPEEIEPVKRALGEIELLRREREKLEEKLRQAEEALG